MPSLITCVKIGGKSIKLTQGQNYIRDDVQGLEPSFQSNSLIPVGVIYLMENEIAQRSTGDLKLKRTSTIKNLKDVTLEKSPTASSEIEHLSTSKKRSVALEADLLGLPDIEIDTRFYSHEKSVSHSSLDRTPTVSQNNDIAQKYTSGDHSRSDLKDNKSRLENTENKSKTAGEELNNKSLQENTDDDDSSELNKIKTENEKNSKFYDDDDDRRMIESRNDKFEDDLENGLARSERYKQYTKQKNVSINRIKYVNNNRRQTGAINSRPPATESLLTNQNPGDITNPIITQDLLDIRSQARSQSELNEQGSTRVSGKPGIKGELVERGGNLLSLGNLLPPIGLLLGLQTGLKHSQRPVSTGLLGLQSPSGIQNLVGAQSLAKSKNQQDSNDLSDRSRIEPTGEPLERGNDLLSVGNLIPPVGLSLGLQTGSKYSRRPPNTGQAGSLIPAGIQNLLGTINPLKSEYQLDYAEPLARRNDLLSVGNPIPPVGLSLGLQTGSKHSRRPPNTGQASSLIPAGIQNLLGTINPLKSEDQLDYADFNYRSGNGREKEHLERDNNLQSVKDRVPTTEILADDQAEPEHARNTILSRQVADKNSLDLKDFEKSEIKKDALDMIERSGNEINRQQLERGGKLLSIGNPLPPLGLLLGLQTGSKNTKDSNGNLLTIGNPLPPVGLQLGVQSG